MGRLNLKLAAGGLLVLMAFSYYKGIECGKMLALKSAYQVYKKQVPWRCN